MVSLVEHAADDRAPGATAWLLSGAVALGLISLIVTLRPLVDYVRFPNVYQPLSWALTLGALASLLAGALRPAPWLLALLLYAVLSLVWLFAIGLWVKTGDPAAQVPATDKLVPRRTRTAV